MDNFTPSYPQCRPKSRCGKFRVCASCARLRQAKIADQAIKLLGTYKQITWYRITPNLPDRPAFKQIRWALKKRLDGSPALWTIEQGQIKGHLHMNLITPHSGLKPVLKAQSWRSQPSTKIRQIAAYISKQSQLPDDLSYQGRIYGYFKGITDTMLDERMSPIVQAALFEMHAPVAKTAIMERERLAIEAYKAPQSMEDYRAIAMRHLPNIAAMLENKKQRA